MALRYTILIATLFAAVACSDAKAESGTERAPVATPGADNAEAHLPKMLAIHAGYCSVCHEMKPLVESIAAKCDKKNLTIDIVDVSEEQNEFLIEDYRVVALPTYLFIDAEGHEVARLVGAQTDSTLKQALSALTGKECPGLGKIRKGSEASNRS